MNSTQLSEYKLRDDVICEMVDQDMILFNTSTNCIVNLNRTASAICTFLQEKIRLDDLVDQFYEQIKEENRPSKQCVKNDVCLFLKKLEQLDLLVVE